MFNIAPVSVQLFLLLFRQNVTTTVKICQKINFLKDKRLFSQKILALLFLRGKKEVIRWIWTMELSFLLYGKNFNKIIYLMVYFVWKMVVYSFRYCPFQLHHTLKEASMSKHNLDQIFLWNNPLEYILNIYIGSLFLYLNQWKQLHVILHNWWEKRKSGGVT